MNAIATKKRIIQEGIELDPGHCKDPLIPLRESGLKPDGGIALHLYETAQNIDNWGTGEDWLNSFEDDADTLKKDLFSWYKIALRVWKIKLFRSYRDYCDSFEAFCQKFLGVTASSMNGGIRAARVISQLISLGFERLPRSQSVCSELQALEEADLGDTWRNICEKFQDHEITAEKVKLCISDPFGKLPALKQIRIPFKWYEWAKEQAAIAGKPFNSFIDSIFESFAGDQANDGAAICREAKETSTEEWLDTQSETWPELTPSSPPNQGIQEIHNNDPDECQSPPTKRDLPPNLEAVGSQEPVTDFKAIATIPTAAIATPKTPRITADFEQFRTVYNETKPQMWAEWYTVNDAQKKKILQSIKECGTQENALIALTNALKYCASDSWWSSKKMTFLAIVRDGRLTEFHEKFIHAETQPSHADQQMLDNIAYLRSKYPDDY